MNILQNSPLKPGPLSSLLFKPSLLSLYDTPTSSVTCNYFKFYYQPAPTQRKRKYENDSKTLPSRNLIFRENGSNWFNALPCEIIKTVFYFLNMSDLGRVASVCWMFQRLCCDESLWLHHYHIVWHNRPEQDAYFREHPISWKKLSLVRRSTEVEYFCENYRHVIPEDTQMFLQWGDFLCKEASSLVGTDNDHADRLFFIAMQEYDSAVTVSNSECYSACIHWGDALSDVALTKSGRQREEFFQMSHDKFEMAKSIMSSVNLMDTDHLKLGSVDLSLYGIGT